MMEKKEILKRTAGDVKHKKTELENLNSRLREAQDVHHEQELALESLTNKQESLEEALQQLKETQNELDSSAREQCSPDQFEESLEYLKQWCEEIGYPESELSAAGARKQIVILKRMVRNLQNESGESYEELMVQKYIVFDFVFLSWDLGSSGREEGSVGETDGTGERTG